MPAALYTDEDMSALIATLLKSRGLDVTTVPEQTTLGKTDREQVMSLGGQRFEVSSKLRPLKIANSLGRCLLTHNRVDFERLHLQYLNENKQHSGIIIVPQKNAYEIARRIGVLVSALTVKEINNQLLYA